MTRWALILLLAVPAAAEANGGRVYLFRGNGVDINIPSVYAAGDKLAAFVRRTMPGASFQSLHQTQRNRAYAEILAGWHRGERGPITLIGHSYGVPAAIDVARRLGEKGIPVAKIVAVDARQGLTPMRGRSVPDNVGSFVNFYENVSLLPGTRVFTREKDGSAKGIRSSKVDITGAMPHSQLLAKLVDGGQLTAALAGGSFNGVYDGGTNARAARPAPVAAPARKSRSVSRSPALLPRKTRASFSPAPPNPRAARMRAAASEGWKRGGPVGWLLGLLKGFFTRASV